jgi:hypothetical protein
MASPIQFYRNFQSLMRDHGLRHVLTSGMACVEYGIQQNTKDTDWIIHPDDLEKLRAMLCHCERGLTGANWRVSYRSLFGAPFLKEYHQGGWTTHIAIHDEATSPEHHLDFFGKPPRVPLEDVFATAKGHLASRDTIAQMKKTDPYHEWPVECPFAQQHEMLVHAVQTHHLPADPLGDTLAKEKLIEQAILAVLEVFDGNEPLVLQLTPPLSELLP